MLTDTVRGVVYGFAAVTAIAYVLALTGLYLRRQNRFVYLAHPANIVWQCTCAAFSALLIVVAILHDVPYVACEITSVVYAVFLPLCMVPSVWSMYLIYYDSERHRRKARLRCVRDHLDAALPIFSSPLRTRRSILAASNTTPPENSSSISFDSNREEVRTGTGNTLVRLLSSDSHEFYLTEFNLSRLRYVLASTFVLCLVHAIVYLVLRFALPATLPSVGDTSEVLASCIHNYRYAFLAECGMYLLIMFVLAGCLFRVYEPIYRTRIASILLVGYLIMFILILLSTVHPEWSSYPYVDLLIFLTVVVFIIVVNGMSPVLFSLPLFRVIFCCERCRAITAEAEQHAEEHARMYRRDSCGCDVEKGATLKPSGSSYELPRLPENTNASPELDMALNRFRDASLSLSLGSVDSLGRTKGIQLVRSTSRQTLLTLLLRSRELRDSFRDYLDRQWSIELFAFYIAAFRFSQSTEMGLALYNEALKIFDEFIQPNAPLEINIAASTRHYIISVLDTGHVDLTLFDQARKEVEQCICQEHLIPWSKQPTVSQLLQSS